LTAACPEPAAGCEPVTHEGPWDPPLVEWDAAAPDAAVTPQDAAPAPQDAAPAPQDAAPAPGDVSINPLAPPEPSGCAARPAASTGFGALAAALFGAVVVRRSRRRD
jgi:hypothetical protein